MNVLGLFARSRCFFFNEMLRRVKKKKKKGGSTISENMLSLWNLLLSVFVFLTGFLGGRVGRGVTGARKSDTSAFFKSVVSNNEKLHNA